MARPSQDDVSKRLDAEKDEQLDLRHRLGADGKPYGKVVDFKLSELRIVKLLEHMCSSLSQHHDFNTTSGYWEFIYKPYAMHRTLERKTHQQKFDNFCASLLEEVEDDLAGALIEGEVDSQGACKWCGGPSAALEVSFAIFATFYCTLRIFLTSFHPCCRHHGLPLH